MKISPGDSKGDLGISSLLPCRQPVQSQLLVCDHLQSRLRGALEAAWRRIPNTYRWDPHPLPAPDTTTHPKCEGEYSICRSATCTRRYWCRKAEEGEDFLQNLLRCLVLRLHALLREKELPLTSLWCSLPICKMKTVLALKGYREA